MWSTRRESFVLGFLRWSAMALLGLAYGGLWVVERGTSDGLAGMSRAAFGVLRCRKAEVCEI